MGTLAPRRTGPPRPPPTPEQILALAKKECVPARIAKGELDGKMKARIWRKLHSVEAKRFDQAYALMGKTPGLELPDAFGLLQSGLPLEEFQARRARADKKKSVKTARATVDGALVAALLEGMRERREELAVVLGERTVLDFLLETRPVAFQFEKAGRVEKLQVVLMLKRSAWEVISKALERDSGLAQKPAPVAREPERRPFSDPRTFLPSVGHQVRLTLRNGVLLSAPLTAVGPFDLILKVEGAEVFIPIHAVFAWEQLP